MQRMISAGMAAALIAAGLAGDRLLGAGPAQPVAASSIAVPTGTHARGTPTRSGTRSASTGVGIDAVIERAFARASRSVVYVNNVGVGSGSGVIYDPSGDIVTNAHVVAGAQVLRVTLNSGRTLGARLIGTDPADDLAVIRVNASGLPAARFAGAGAVAVAQTVLAIGSPLGLQQSVTSGLISALGRTVQEANGAYLPNAIQTSAPINPGNSGGALVTLDGTVVGIPTLEASDPQNNNGGAAQGIGFAVPSTRVTTVAHQIIATGRVEHTGRAFLGVAATDQSGANGGSTQAIAGAVVRQVAARSPAEQAGVRAGDVLVAIDGSRITGEADLLTALAQEQPGATIRLVLNRNGTTHTVRVRLGELPAAL